MRTGLPPPPPGKDSMQCQPGVDCGKPSVERGGNIIDKTRTDSGGDCLKEEQKQSKREYTM